MYRVTRTQHEKYGNVIEVVREENGPFKGPFWAVQQARKEKRLWLESGAKKVRILIDNKVMTIDQAEHWSNEEYRNLPKCETCGTLLDGDVHTHRLCGSSLFCSADCADKDYAKKTEVDNEETEFELL